jgi:hypothetical protein
MPLNQLMYAENCVISFSVAIATAFVDRALAPEGESLYLCPPTQIAFRNRSFTAIKLSFEYLLHGVQTQVCTPAVPVDKESKNMFFDSLFLNLMAVKPEAWE